MIRLLIIRALVIAIPFVLYALWRWVQRLRGHYTGRIWDQAPTLWLFTMGVVLAALSLLIPVVFAAPTVGP